MLTVVKGFAAVWFSLLGKSNFKALGCTIVEVTIKKMSNRKTMSVIEDILNEASILVLRFKAIKGEILKNKY